MIGINTLFVKKKRLDFVFLSQTGDPPDADETIANFSRDFYQQLEK